MGDSGFFVIIGRVNQVTYVGHATLLIELDGANLLTDPLLTLRVGHLLRTSQVPALSSLPLDAVLLSHLHADHVHLRSLRRLGKDQLLIAPRGSAGYLARHGFHRVVEMEVGDSLRVKDVTIEAAPSDHAGRSIPGRPRTDCLGYIIRGSRSIYFSGDTDLFAGMADIGPALDVALLPVWGWGPTLGPGHMDPYRAAKSLEMLRPTLAIPIHWGTYFPAGLRPFMPTLTSRPPHEFARYAGKIAPEVQVCVLDPGDALGLSGLHTPMGGAGSVY